MTLFSVDFGNVFSRSNVVRLTVSAWLLVILVPQDGWYDVAVVITLVLVGVLNTSFALRYCVPPTQVENRCPVSCSWLSSSSR